MDPAEAMSTVKAAGIEAFEFWNWQNKDLDAIKEAKEGLGLDLSTFCTLMISLVDESKHEEYLAGLKETIDKAGFLGCNRLISQVGAELTGVPRKKQHENLVIGLKICAPILEQSGIMLMIEPLNTLVNHKGYYLYSSDEAFEIIDEVGCDKVKILYDIYHQQIMEGNLISRIQANIEKIGHFHAAGNPGRHELSIGEINYKNVFVAIRETGYDGYVGLEYFPQRDPLDGLKEAVELAG